MHFRELKLSPNILILEQIQNSPCLCGQILISLVYRSVVWSLRYELLDYYRHF